MEDIVCRFIFPLESSRYLTVTTFSFVTLSTNAIPHTCHHAPLRQDQPRREED